MLLEATNSIIALSCFADIQKRAEPTRLLQVRDLYRMLFAAEDTTETLS